MLQRVLGVDAGFVQNVEGDFFLFFSGIWVFFSGIWVTTFNFFWAVEGGLVLNVEGGLLLKASLVGAD